MSIRVRVCTGIACKNCFSDDLFKRADKLSQNKEEIEVEKRSCTGNCSNAINVEIIDDKNRRKIVHRCTEKTIDDIMKDPKSYLNK